MPAALVSKLARLVVVAACIGLSGCAGLTPVTARAVRPPLAEPTDTRQGWWSVRLQWQWPADVEPAWHLDLWAAHQIFLPILNSQADHLFLWRFHRRAARDDAGHQFSLIFYAAPGTAEAIYAAAAADPLLSRAVAAGILLRVKTESVSALPRPQVSDTSDSSWSPALQAAWPYYICGASRMWLQLVADAANERMAVSAPTTIVDMTAFYLQVETDITGIWQQEGRHALLHHLNALFGYRPMPMRF